MEVLDSNGSGPTGGRPLENGEAQTPYQVILHAAPPTNAAWFAFCRANVISMGAAHVLAREVERSGSATLGTYPNKDAAEEIVRVLREEVGIGGDGIEREGVTCIPASGGGGEMAPNASRKVGACVDGGGDAEPDKKKAKVTASDDTLAAVESSTGNDATAASKEKEKKVVNPEIRRLYDEGTITQAEYERMTAADRLFESEVAAAPATFAVTKSSATMSAEQQFEYNNGRRPDVYDAYAHRHDRRFWVNGRLYEANVRTLDAVCLVEFCRKFTIPKKGASEGKIKYHRHGVITKKLQFHPEYSSDPTFEGGRDYGMYCRFALVRYRPWVDAPFGRVVPDEDGGGEGEGSGTAATAEYKPEEDECIRQWREFLLELRERMHLIPDVLLPEELKGGGAGIELLVVPTVERADEVDRTVGGDGGEIDDEKKVEQEEGANADPRTLDDVIRAAEKATLAMKAAETADFGATNADAAVISDDDGDDDEEEDDNEEETNNDDVLPSSFTDLGKAIAETAAEDDKEEREEVAEDENDENEDEDDNPFASFVSNKMSEDDGDNAEEDQWLSSVMAVGAVAADAAERSSEDTEDVTDDADIEQENSAKFSTNLDDDSSFDSITKMFDDAKKPLSAEVSDEAPDAGCDELSDAASDDSSQIEEVYNDFSRRKESDVCTPPISAKDNEAKDSPETEKPEANTETTDAIAFVTPKKAIPKSRSSPEEANDACATSGAAIPNVRTRNDTLPFLKDSNATKSSASPVKQELEELRVMLKGRASERKIRIDAFAGKFTDEQSRIEELRRMSANDRNVGEVHREFISSALIIQSAWRRHKAQQMMIKHQAAVRQHGSFVKGCVAMWKAKEATTQQESAAIAIQSAARGYNSRRQFVALVQGCIALQAIARGSKARSLGVAQDEDDFADVAVLEPRVDDDNADEAVLEPRVEEYNYAATAVYGDTNLTDEYCGSNASVEEYFTATEDADNKRLSKKGEDKKRFGRKKNQKPKGYSGMQADSESDTEIDQIPQSKSFFGRKSLAADGYYSEMLGGDYLFDSDTEVTTGSPTRSSRNSLPKRRVKKIKDKDGGRKSLVGSLLRKSKDSDNKKSVVADIVDEEDTSGSILLSARRPRPKSKSKKSRAKKNKTRGVNKEAGPEAPEFWQGFTVDMEESDIESDWEDDGGSFQTSVQKRSTPKVFDIRPIEEEEEESGNSNELDVDDPFASPTPHVQCDFSKDAFPEDAVAVTPDEFSSFLSKRYVFPEEPLIFKPDEGTTSKSPPASAPTPDDGPGPLTQAAIVDSANIFPMENFRWEATFGDENKVAAEASEPTNPASQAENIVVAPETSGKTELNIASSGSPREVSADDILVDLEGSLQTKDKSVASSKSRLKSLFRKNNNEATEPKPSKPDNVAASLLMSVEGDGAMNFGRVDIPSEDDPSSSRVNISLNRSADEVEVAMDAASRRSSGSTKAPVDAASLPSTEKAAALSARVEELESKVAECEEEDMPVIAPSTITMTRFHTRPTGRTYKTKDNVQF